MKLFPFTPQKSLLAMACCLALMGNSGCRWIHALPKIPSQDATSAKRTVVLCLFDISGSTGSQEIRAKYFAQFNTLVRRNPSGTAYLVALISNNSWSTPGRSLRLTMPLRKDFKSQEDFQIEFLQVNGQLLGYTKRMIFMNTGKGHTDLVGSMVNAAKMLKGSDYGTFEDKRIVIFSDMVEQTAEHDFTDARLLEPANTEQILKGFKESGRFPDLKGVSIWVVGAGDSAGGGLAASITYQIQNWWLDYFQATGAEIDATRYGSELFNYPEAMK